MATEGVGVLAQAVVQGLVGGMLSAAMGGAFVDGFIGAAAGSLLGSAMRLSPAGVNHAGAAIVRIIMRAMIGGTISAMNGGSFANGAIAAAFTAAVQEALARSPEFAPKRAGPLSIDDEEDVRRFVAQAKEKIAFVGGAMDAKVGA